MELLPSAQPSSQNENFVCTENFSHSSLFHVKTRVCLKYFMNDCSFLHIFLYYHASVCTHFGQVCHIRSLYEIQSHFLYHTSYKGVTSQFDIALDIVSSQFLGTTYQSFCASFQITFSHPSVMYPELFQIDRLQLEILFWGVGCDAPYGSWGKPWWGTRGQTSRKLQGVSTLKSLTSDQNIPSTTCDETNSTSFFQKNLA